MAMNAGQCPHRFQESRNAVLQKDVTNTMDSSCEQWWSLEATKRTLIYCSHLKETVEMSRAYGEGLEKFIITGYTETKKKKYSV